MLVQYVSFKSYFTRTGNLRGEKVRFDYKTENGKVIRT